MQFAKLSFHLHILAFYLVHLINKKVFCALCQVTEQQLNIDYSILIVS